jgi:stress response protein SCP2
VGAIYLTLSAWGSARLSDIIRPEVRCFDPDDRSGVPLARYELDGRPTGEQTAVVMAKIWRTAPGHTWKVTAIGELGLGRAGNYTPIHNIIAQTMR